LERSPDQHIETAELARLLEDFRLRGDSVPAVAEIHPHLAGCPTCREHLNELASFEHQLRNVRTEQSPSRRIDCPGPDIWREIAGGFTPPDATLAGIDHASRCDHCGPLLRGAVSELSILNGEITDAERKQIANLESARADWQQDLARQITAPQRSKLRRESAPWLRRWLAVPRLAIAGASLLAVVGVGSWIVIHRNQPATANVLLARAYTEKRTLELRIAGARYAPLRVSRGSASSFTSRPPALLKAEALIASQLQSHPSDPAWLQAKAQADLLEGKYDAAVEALRRALELNPHSPAILTDLATAFFQRAQQEGRRDDLGAAYEYLSQALQIHPDDPVSLFNRAIVAEHQFLFHQALEDWTRYLRLDPASDWATEAREAFTRVQARLKQHDTSQAAPLLSPEQIASAAGSASFADVQGLRSTVDRRIEEYVSGAIRSWLPQAYSERTSAAPAAQRALFFLADLTSQRHHDNWLAELLRGSSAPSFRRAVTALAKAAQANDAGEFAVADAEASQAERFFQSSDNRAGVLRAKFEQIFSAQFERHGEQCRQQAATALEESEKHSYPWLQIQLGLEQGVCAGLMGDFGGNERSVRRAVHRAQRNQYNALYLRALGFAAGVQTETGNASEAWNLIGTGLNSYWAEQVPAMRGYNLYTELARVAETAIRPNLEMATWGEAESLVDSDEDPLLRAWAHNDMGNAAAAAHQHEIASAQYAEAGRLFALSPRTEASRNYVMETEIRTAQQEARQGEFEDALARLTHIQDQIRQIPDSYLGEMFYSALGELQLSRHRAAEAERSLRPALALAEQSLTSIHSEGQRIAWSKNTAPLYLGLVEAELIQGHSQKSLETYESYLGASQRAGTARQTRQTLTNASVPIADLSPAAPHLSLLSRETVVAFAATPDGLAIWVFDDRGVNARWIPTPVENLQELAARFHNLASDPKSDLSAFRRDAGSLYAAFITPVEPWLTTERTLVIEADGWISRIPFEALLDANGHYLIERAPIVHSLGQGSEARLRNDNAVSTASLALVVGSGASSQSEGLIPLPDVAHEADTVAAQFKSSRILKGGAATLAALKNDLPSAAVFHFAGHSLSTPSRTGLLLESDQPSGVVSSGVSGDLAGDAPADVSLLDADTLRHLNLHNMRLAMLSACGSDSGKAGSSEFNNIAETLLRAGVPHVVASRWAVDSVEANGFVDDFYRNALAGQNISAAVRLTSRRMLANPRTSHPYYWSAFAAYGQP
jgi:CHAT domain-containing protein/cytochrome c-type biogenesis protein CcmH/NrfG